ncbi:MAG: hypothetical protein JSW34_09880 [Candidatus Zixiibacteriota bacterium]|nr:MAG: hypothetical protein JSW34_09880 [candidate division Zixibacteria bacterium]
MAEVDLFFKVASLVLALTSVVGGGGWYKSHRELALAKQENCALKLEGFYYLMQAQLEYNRVIHTELTQDPRLGGIMEYDPRRLREVFEQQPDDSYEKLMWKARVERLMDGNRLLVKMIDDNIGRVLSKELREACMKFKHHAQLWEDLWESVTTDHHVFSSSGYDRRFHTQPFPDELVVALNAETEILEKSAGK